MQGEIAAGALHGKGFNLSAPSGSGLVGTFLFDPIQGTEEGFRVPEAEFRCFHEVEDLNRWRI
jgi:hypothetical protein